MFFSKKHALGLSTLFCLSLPAPLLAENPKEPAEAFLKRYFQTLHTAKSLEELRPFYPAISTKGEEEFENAPPDMKKMVEQLALGMCKQEPRTIKILNQTEKNGKVNFLLAPDEIPAEFKKHANDPKFSMTGAVSLISENGQWKVYKDYWKVKTYEQGDLKVSFGRDPDGDEKDPADKMQTPSQSFDDSFRRVFTKDWKAQGKGSVQTTFKIENGALTEIQTQTKGDKEQAEFIKNLLTSAKVIPVVPKDKEDKPYGWMQFDWNDNSYCVNGPFFGSEPQKMMSQ